MTNLATDIAGHSVVLHFTDPVAEYNALRHSAALVDRSHRHRLVLEGRGVVDSLNGLVTNDVAHLELGSGQYAAALTPKGKIIADVRIFRRANNTFLIDTAARAAEGWMGTVRKYLNPRTAKYTEQSAELVDLGVFGPAAAEKVAGVLSLDAQMLREQPPYALLETEWRGSQILIAVSSDLAVPGFDIFAPAAAGSALKEAFADAGVGVAGLTAWEMARIENGTPEWGVDMDDTTLAQEANLDRLHAVSYTKGCYTGQEVVARVHFRGHVNQNLRMLRFVSSAVPPRGAKLYGEEGREIGDIRSSAHSPKLGGVAIAMVRREAPVGSSVTVKWDNVECQAGVYEIPLEPSAA